MVLQKLIERFETVNQLPVEIPEVRDAIVSLGVQDDIRFCPDDRVDTAVLRGLYYQYTTHSAPYSEPTFCSLIVFSNSLPKEWQRLIACKELMHVLDNKSERTNTLEGNCSGPSGIGVRPGTVSGRLRWPGGQICG